MLTVLDLFSGIGGFALGLESTGGFRTVAFCEIEPFCREVLRKHWPDVPIHEDVRELRGGKVGSVDMICGGFPCQDISVAGKGAGLHGSRSGLWFEAARLVGELGPRWCLFENVGALRTRGIDRVCSDLEAQGYAVWPLVVGAWAVGAPHRRERIWIVAHRSGDALREQPGRGSVAGGDGAVGLAHRHGDGQHRERSGGVLDGERAASRHDADGRGEWAVGEPDGTRAKAGLSGSKGSNEERHPEEPNDAMRRPCFPEPESKRRPEQGHGRHAGPRLGCDGPRWPARPGEPQHEWEEPRLVGHPHVRHTQRRTAAGFACEAGSATGRGKGCPEQPMGSAVARLRERLARCVVVTDGTAQEDGPREVLRLLSKADDSEAIQRTLGRHVRISQASLLRLAMHGTRQGNRRSRSRNAAESYAEGHSADERLRTVLQREASSAASHQQGQDGQQAGERRDALRVMPRERPLEEREAQILLDYLMNERLARRSNREALKAYGNSVVPQVVAVIGRAILAAEAGLTS